MDLENYLYIIFFKNKKLFNKLEIILILLFFYFLISLFFIGKKFLICFNIVVMLCVFNILDKKVYF